MNYLLNKNYKAASCWRGRIKSVIDRNVAASLLKICAMLCLLLIPLGVHAQITGSNLVCENQTINYGITPQTGYSYTWTISSAPAGIIIGQSNSSASIVWSAGGASVITVTGTGGGPTITYTLNVTVEATPNPVVTYDVQVGCQTQPQQSNGHSLLDDDNGCVKVCEHSNVTYTVTGGANSTFSWAASGVNTTSGTLTGTGITLPVTWGNVGTGSISVIETTPAGCQKQKLVCIEIIAIPKAQFNIDNNTYTAGGCVPVCLGQVINFTDLSIPNSGTAILSRHWDFGDNVFPQIAPYAPTASIPNPTHAYSTPGIYIVTLTVTNQCGCTSTFEKCVDVSNQPGPTIACASAICENGQDHYCVPTISCPMPITSNWTVTGGTIIPPGSNYCIDVLWNNVGADGFGYVSFDATNCNEACNNITTIAVPVIQNIGTIVGNSTVCANSYNIYKLPAWPATNFTWSLGSNNTANATLPGATYNGNEVSVFAANTGSFTLNCSYINTLLGCGGSATYTVQVQPQITIAGPQKVCVNTNVVYTLTGTVTGTTTYTLIDPVNATSTVVTGTGNTVTLNFPSAGLWQVQVSNPNFCPPEPMTVQVLDPPPPPTLITGADVVCEGQPYTYHGSSLFPGTVYYWEAYNGSTLVNSGYGANYTVSWSFTPSPVNTLKLYKQWGDVYTNCNSTPLTMTITKSVADYTITTTANGLNPCENGTYGYNLTAGANNTATPEFIEWSVLTQNYGSVTSGQGTSSVSLTFNNIPNPTQAATVQCKVTVCGQVYTFTLPITITKAPALTVTNNSPKCSGQGVTISVNPSGTYNYNYGDGVTVNNITGTSSTHPYTLTGNNVGTFVVNVSGTVTGCPLPSAGQTTVTINPNPSITLSPSGTLSNCIPFSQQVVLAAPPSGVYNVAWTGQINASGTINNGSPTSLLSQTLTNYGLESVTVTNTSTGCQSAASVNIVQSCGPPPPTCTPLGPAGIGALTQNDVSCDQGIYTANVSASGILTNGTNILGYLWIYSSGLTNTGTGGSFAPPNATSNNFTATQAGLYYVSLDVYYKDANNPGQRCTKSATQIVKVYLIADFTSKILCNGTNNGYNVTMTDNSSVLAGYTVTSYEWKLDGGSWVNSGTNYIYTLPTSLTSGAHTLYHRVTLNNGKVCTRSYIIDIPTLPAANFSYTTTNTPTSTCEGRTVQFTDLSTPSANLTGWLWSFNDPIFPPTTIQTQNPGKVYQANSTSGINVGLTITDKYGCVSTTTQPLTIYHNNMAFAAPPASTYLPPVEYKCVGTSSSVALNWTPPGVPPYTYQWYNGNGLLSGYSGNPINVTTTGQYWTQVTDGHNCVSAANPTPAIRGFYDLPDAIISGSHDACENDPYTLSGINGSNTGITYSWSRRFNGGTWVSAGSTATITEAQGTPGLYEYQLTTVATYPGGISCSSAPSPIFAVTVHGLPAAPTASFNIIDCNTYETQLTATSSTSPAYYNWSNGAFGTPVTVYDGGEYRLWLTDQYGCKSHTDLDVPLAPSAYFWRFPQGCYTFCPGQLPRQVDGPFGVNFNFWQWDLYDGSMYNPLPNPNGTYATSGNNATVDPLWIDFAPPMGNGNGTGLYSWILDNGYCQQTIDNLGITILEDCCTADLLFQNVYCYDPVTHTYMVDLVVNTSAPGGTVVSYVLEGLDPNPPYSNVGTCTPSTGSFTTTSTALNFTFTPTNYFTLYVMFRITITYIEKGVVKTCIGEVVVELVDCAGGSPKPAGTQETPATATHYLLPHPNPFTNTLTISYRYSEPVHHATLKVRDMYGRVMMSKAVTEQQGEWQVPTDQLAAGVYTVEQTDEGKTIAIQKIIKQ